MTSSLDREGAGYELVGTRAGPGRLVGRGVRGGQLDRLRGPAGQLGAGHLGGLAPGGRRRSLAGHVPALPTQGATGGPGDFPAAVKNQVRQLRTERGLAQGQLAEAMGVSRQTINSIENDRYTPSLPLAMALARYFGVPVEEMFSE